MELFNRFSFTPEEKQAIELVTTYMEQAGMSVTIDAVGNLIGTYGEGNETIMLGSHIDTVPEGGKFDGALGVLAAIEVVHTIHEQQLLPSKKIQVVAFKDEEGTRFGFGLLGSSAIQYRHLLNEKNLNEMYYYHPHLYKIHRLDKILRPCHSTSPATNVHLLPLLAL